MKRTVRVVAGILVAVILALLAGGVIVYFSLSKAVPAGIAHFGPMVTGTQMTLADFDLSLLRRRLELKDLIVGNPEGFQTEYAFRLRRVLVRFDLWSALGETVHVREVRIEAPEIIWEVGPTGTNIGKIKKHAEALAGPPAPKSGKPEKKPAAPTRKKAGKKLVIDDFVLSDAKVSISATFAGGRKVTVALPTVHLRNIGASGGGKSIGEVLAEVTEKVTEAVTQAAKSGAGIGVEGLDSAKEAATGAAEAVKKQAGAPVEAVKGLLGGRR